MMPVGVFAGVAVVATAAAGCGRIGFAPVGGGLGDGDGGPGDDSGITLNGDTISAIASNLVFVTSTSKLGGAYGGLAGGDAECQARAMAQGFPGTYVAYLSTSTVNAVDRLGSARGWSRLDGLPVFDTVADIKVDAMFYPPELDDLGRVVALGVRVAAGTALNGIASGQDCAGWTSTAGMVNGGTASGTQWVNTFYGASCAVAYPIYCFGVDRAVPTMPPVIASRRAFLTQGQWMSGGGISSADAFCQGEASTAGLPGTYLALLATTTASAISRFDLSGPPWVRLDNTALAASNAGFAAGNELAALDTTTALTHVFALVVTGASSPDAPGTTALTCADWTAKNPSQRWQQGNSSDVGTLFFSNGGGVSTCNNAGNLYCLQQ
jgi:hypothetical protein